MPKTKTQSAKKSKARSVRAKAGSAPKPSSKRTSRLATASTRIRGAPAIKGAGKVARARFQTDLIARGEAALADECGDLPPGATHEICKPAHAGKPAGAKAAQIKRRRYSML